MHLRQGQANDALEWVRLTIKQIGMSLAYKKKQVRGQRDNTRAQAQLKADRAKRDKHVRDYRMARDAMLRLGMPEDDATYRPLDDTDLWMKDLTHGHALGDGTRKESWIWRSVRGSTLSERVRSEWETDGSANHFHSVSCLTHRFSISGPSPLVSCPCQP